MPRVMIVDDEPYIVKSVKTILEKEGYSVVGAESGDDCLKKLEKEPVDLILMDFFMPGMDGRAVIERIRENPDLKSTKIAFLTSASFREKGLEILDVLGVSDYIVKPIEVHNFTSKIKKIFKNNEK
ncbi:MAG: hypothetical protein A7316_00440 [Candidatus Altiarchaeales archaeon WOR_SM1_86-2]|nr:MAG: hypothetical protein A7316_00440 [Candidatus Altiarchaeales archaeon WOR_SM1_86-2]